MSDEVMSNTEIESDASSETRSNTWRKAASELLSSPVNPVILKKFWKGTAILVSGIAFAVFMDQSSRNPANTLISRAANPDSDPNPINPVGVTCFDQITALLQTQGNKELTPFASDLAINAQSNQALCNLSNRYIAISRNMVHEYTIARDRFHFGDEPIVWNRFADFKLELLIEFLLASEDTVSKESILSILNLISNGEEIPYNSLLLSLMEYLMRNEGPYSTTQILGLILALDMERKTEEYRPNCDVDFEGLMGRIDTLLNPPES